ncbi:MAG: MBL fold metallo-hydrolase [Clostridia bacterium]|nr:MBL fold metallo-hydrolase [Clostridia bacterium]
MKLTVLGARGAWPSATEGTCAFLLQTGLENILVECGSGALAAVQKHIALQDIDAVVLSHLHADHACELPLLGYARARLTPDKPVAVYAPNKPEFAWEYLQNNGHSMHAISAGDTIHIGAITIKTYNTQHPFPGVSLRFEAENKIVAYSGDTCLTPEIQKCAQDADVFLANTAFTQALLAAAPHLSAKDAATTAKAAKVKRLVLAHIMPTQCAEEALREARGTFAETVIGQNGLF